MMIATVWIALFFYSFVGVLTYRLHERVFPGESEGTQHMSEVAGVFWPAMLPITLAFYAVEEDARQALGESGEDDHGSA
ncbi:MAG: hypothetical protein GWN53_17115 [Gammaproteobacteria bacterium]|uniref:Uncharacterized protein n=1 Tax=Candidatus Kutchimonas denitrificans TaxID=3056748 RepID=A0AAE4ZD71_9BACT|nr:hypothetical protein [Candidatus Kutchimonas denitrificans]NIV53562.1 hypothetical protein [Gammaproteobacteria bacterium]